MTIQSKYRSTVNKLPINNQKKNWLVRNWKGFLVGWFLSPILFTFIWDYMSPICTSNCAGEGGMAIPIMVILAWTIGPYFAVKNAMKSGVDTSTFFLMSSPIGAFIGAFIQSKLRGR